LFRREVFEARKDRLHGDISLAVPVSWQAVGYLLFGALASALFFLATASYARVETVSGAIVIDKGTASVVASRAGIVARLGVADGQRVRAGQLLAEIRSEEDLVNGGTAPQRILESLSRQDRQLGNQAALILNAASAEQSRLMASVARAQQEMMTSC
jgi:membrane fusion protein